MFSVMREESEDAPGIADVTRPRRTSRWRPVGFALVDESRGSSRCVNPKPLPRHVHSLRSTTSGRSVPARLEL